MPMVLPYTPYFSKLRILNFIEDKIENTDCTHNSKFYKIEKILNFNEDKIENNFIEHTTPGST